MDAEPSTSVPAPTAGLKRPNADEFAEAEPAEKRQKFEADSKAPDSAPEAATSVPAAEGSSSTPKGGERKGRGKGQTRGSARNAREQDKKQGVRRGTRRSPSVPREDGAPREPRLPKRQTALLLGFCGSGYSGMQIQRTDEKIKTIEGTLFDALVRVGAVSKDNADNPGKVNFNRAARTDAGVHAAGNLVSMKMISAIPGVEDIVARINEELPPEIRLWGTVRVQNSFNARASCDARKYTYFFPSYLLIPPKPGSAQHKIVFEQNGASTPLLDFWKDVPADSSADDDLTRKRSWRAPKEAVGALRTTAKMYEGSHKFHNFTVGQEYKDHNSQRVLKKLEVADPVVYGDTEWISVLLHGQSFMLHQRKMISLLVLSSRTGTPPSVVEEFYGPRKAFIPKMPALGLLLEYPIFDNYNKKIASSNDKLKPDDPEYRMPIDFEVHREKIEQFKQDFIYSRMRSIESQSGLFDAFIRSVDKYQGNDLQYLNPKGVLPDSAVMKRGERRENAFREKKRFDTTVFPEGRISKFEIEEAEEADEDAEEEVLPTNKKDREELEG
ncbi:tRNA pseudouridine synthase [Phanerochaete sordida]|uniref:tRNA pseudouridine synthase n=1 Tax=Phanerochaete sordida TaxID=48140 RepID=A0A9P3GAD7_9APHY|nr:tRNA pseudouridine synthase [Phanerochaete sordida]